MLDFSKSWVKWTVLNGANTLAIDCLNPYVALLAPACAPRVLYNPVVHVACCFVTIPDNKDSMVNSCSASSGIRKNTA